TKEHRREGIELLAALAVCGVINSLVIKNIVDRTRPFDIHTWLDVLVSKPTDFSFPSGHTASSFAAAYIIRRNYGKRLGIPAYMLATAIGLTRVGVGVHYPSDVVAGAAVGTAVAVGASRLVKRFWKIYDIKQEKKECGKPKK
ncbi:MAG: phosphatase PAP2 family protein, partial [Clostridiales bacterium]|nr:phosphatase PAP2 family protein [Clostridiales bacterium]